MEIQIKKMTDQQQQETLEILNDVELMKELTSSRKETQQGKETVPWKEAKIHVP